MAMLFRKMNEHESGWWYTFPSEKYDFVSWDDEIPNLWKVIKFHGSKPPTRYISPYYHLVI
jgi:hypothetical protein